MHLGHPASRLLDLVIKECNLPVKGNEGVCFCEACQFGKAHNLPFALSNNRAKKPFDLIHSDLWVRFYVLFVDDHSRFTCGYIL